MDLEHGTKIHFIHVVGTRIIPQGTDGFLRGDMLEVFMSSQDILSFVPLNSGLLDSQRKLLSWIESWCKDIEVLPSED